MVFCSKHQMQLSRQLNRKTKPVRDRLWSKLKTEKHFQKFHEFPDNVSVMCAKSFDKCHTSSASRRTKRKQFSANWKFVSAAGVGFKILCTTLPNWLVLLGDTAERIFLFVCVCLMKLPVLAALRGAYVDKKVQGIEMICTSIVRGTYTKSRPSCSPNCCRHLRWPALRFLLFCYQHDVHDTTL